jgi:Rv0078B-related antitoxin
VILRRQALRLEYPNASNEQIERLLNQWLAHRPGAELGDGPQTNDPSDSTN